MKGKKCNRCENVKPLSAFARNSGMADGHLNQCRECRQAARVYKPVDPAWKRKHRNLYRERHPLKRQAALAVENALRRGDLVRRQCEVCGAAKTHGHHDDYSKPLVVRWLCHKHHMEVHRRT